MAYFLHAIPSSPDKIRQERESQTVCKRCKNKHIVVPEEGISCCPLDDIRFIKRFYIKKINIPVTNIILGRHELELHVDPELFFFEKTFPLQVFEKIPFPMVCKLIDKKDVYDLYERLSAHSSIKINSLANLISLSIILDHLKLFLSYPKPVQTQLLNLRNKTVLENLKRDSTKSKGTHFLEFFLTIMNRCWVHNKELNLTIGVYDWTNILEHRIFPSKPFMKIKGKKLQVPFPFKEDSNMEYIHPYKRFVISENHDKGVITNSEKSLRWIDAHWISHPIPEDLLQKVKNGELNILSAESSSKKGPKSMESVNSATSLTQAQTSQLIQAMYKAQCERIAAGTEEEYYSTIMANRIIEQKKETIDQADNSVPTFEFTTASIPATAEQPAFNPTFAYLNSGQPVEEGESIMQDEVSGSYLVEAFQNFQNQMATSQNGSIPPPNDASAADPTVFIPYPLPPMMRPNKQPYDESSTEEEKKEDYLQFIEKNYGANARDVVFKQLLAVGKQQCNQTTDDLSEQIVKITPKAEISDDESSVDSLPLNDEEIQDCLSKLGKQMDARRDLTNYVIQKKRIVRKVPKEEPDHYEENDLGLHRGIQAYFQPSIETYLRNEKAKAAKKNGISIEEEVELVEVEEYVEETAEEAAEAWFQDIVKERELKRSSNTPMTRNQKKKDAKELQFLKEYTYDIERKKRLISKNMENKSEKERLKKQTIGTKPISRKPGTSRDSLRAEKDIPLYKTQHKQEVSSITHKQILDSLERGRKYEERYLRHEPAFSFPMDPNTSEDIETDRNLLYSPNYYPVVDTGFCFPLNPDTTSPSEYARCRGLSYHDRYLRENRSPHIVRLLLENLHIFSKTGRRSDDEDKSDEPLQQHKVNLKTRPDEHTFNEESITASLANVKIEDATEKIHADQKAASTTLIRSEASNAGNRTGMSSLVKPLSPLPGSTASGQTSVMASSACNDSSTTYKQIPGQFGTIKSKTVLSTKFARNRMRATATKRHITHNNTAAAHRLASFNQSCNNDAKSVLQHILPLKFTPMLSRHPAAEYLKQKKAGLAAERTLPFGFGATAHKEMETLSSSDAKPPLQEPHTILFGPKPPQQPITEKPTSQTADLSTKKVVPFILASSKSKPTQANLVGSSETRATASKDPPYIFGASSTKQNVSVSAANQKQVSSDSTATSQASAANVASTSGSDKSSFLFGSQLNATKNRDPLYVETSAESQSPFSNAWSNFIQNSNMKNNQASAEASTFNQYAFPYPMMGSQQATVRNANNLNTFGLLAPQQPTANANSSQFPFGHSNYHQSAMMNHNNMSPFGINPFQQNSSHAAPMHPFGNSASQQTSIFNQNAMADKQNQVPFGLLAPQQQVPVLNANTGNTEGISPYSIPPFLYGSPAQLQIIASLISNPLSSNASPFNQAPFLPQASSFQNHSSFKPNTQNDDDSPSISLLTTLMNNANLHSRTEPSSSNDQEKAEKEDSFSEQDEVEKGSQNMSKTGSKRKFPFQRSKATAFSDMTTALLTMSEKEFIEMAKNKKISILETIEAIKTGIPEVKRIVMTGSQDSDCYEDWKKINEDFIARFKFNALYLLDQLEVDK